VRWPSYGTAELSQKRYMQSFINTFSFKTIFGKQFEFYSASCLELKCRNIVFPACSRRRKGSLAICNSDLIFVLFAPRMWEFSSSIPLIGLFIFITFCVIPSNPSCIYLPPHSAQTVIIFISRDFYPLKFPYIRIQFFAVTALLH
jgi:hypothetical protein